LRRGNNRFAAFRKEKKEKKDVVKEDGPKKESPKVRSVN